MKAAKTKPETLQRWSLNKTRGPWCSYVWNKKDRIYFAFNNREVTDFGRSMAIEEVEWELSSSQSWETTGFHFLQGQIKKLFSKNSSRNMEARKDWAGQSLR